MPIDFEDARDQINSLEFEDWLRRSTALVLRREERIKAEAQLKFNRHPRTRFSRFLHSLADKLALKDDVCQYLS